MKRIVPGYKTILAHDLTYDQAANLVDQIRERKDCVLHDYDIFISSGRNGNEVSWYVYVVDNKIQQAFVNDPTSFIFEIPG